MDKRTSIGSGRYKTVDWSVFKDYDIIKMLRTMSIKEIAKQFNVSVYPIHVEIDKRLAAREIGLKTEKPINEMELEVNDAFQELKHSELYEQLKLKKDELH